MKKAIKFFGNAIYITFAFAIIYMLSGIISIVTTDFTSFPWYTAIYMTLITFCPIIFIETVIYVILTKLDKKTDQ